VSPPQGRTPGGLTWVELRGFEPLTPSMRTLAASVDAGRFRWPAGEARRAPDGDRHCGCCTRCCTGLFLLLDRSTVWGFTGIALHGRGDVAFCRMGQQPAHSMGEELDLPGDPPEPYGRPCHRIEVPRRHTT
jgi:hypothetical protein